MKTYAGLPLLLLISLTVSGQDQPQSNTPPAISAATKQLLKIARSNRIKTFADAFLDPNVVIGVFEYPKEITATGVPTDEALEFLNGYWTAQEKFGVRMMQCVKVIKGDVPVSAVFVCDRLVPDQPEAMRIPSFVPVPDSRWILALEKTTHRSRIARFGEEIDSYRFLEDRTLFRMFHYGYGVLCLQWPQEGQSGSHESRHVQTVPQSTLEDLANIKRVLPLACKDQPTVDEAAAIGLAWRGMKTPMGKAIFGEILGNTPMRPQYPDRGSK
jgi:hypothetical protein